MSGQAASSAPIPSLSAAIKAQLPDAAVIQGLVADAAAARQFVADTQAVQALFADAKKFQQQISQFAQQIESPSVSQLTADLVRHQEFVRQIAQSVTFKLPDFRQWTEPLKRYLPDNLHRLQGLADPFDIALDEGIPFSWIPRPDIVTALVEADSPLERHRILSERQADVLEDCVTALVPLHGERAVQCRAAADALRLGSFGPAQSHASNIVDSIVCDLGGKKPREEAVKKAQQDVGGLSFRLAAEMLTLRPLARAFVQWRPQSGTPIPRHFARHVTAHAVGHSGVFDPQHALIAVMLATSLVAQFERSLP